MTAVADVNRKVENTLAQTLLHEFEQELTITRKFLERVPESKLNWKPHEKSLTAGQLALHIAQVPAGVLRLSMQDTAAPPSGKMHQPSSVSEILQALDDSAADVRNTLPTLSDSRMQQLFRIVQNHQVLMSVPRIVFLRSIMFNHWYHHRGQLGVYLRLLGAKVPSSYGPSGDESPFA
jgi:uncharacterized damage-inducible protein DinB